MRTDKLTTKAQEALQQAQALAESRGHQELTPEHLLSTLLTQDQGVVGHRAGDDAHVIELTA